MQHKFSSLGLFLTLILNGAFGLVCYNCDWNGNREPNGTSCAKSWDSTHIEHCGPEERYCLKFLGEIEGKVAGARRCMNGAAGLFDNSTEMRCLPTSFPQFKGKLDFKVDGTEVKEGLICVCKNNLCNGQAKTSLAMSTIIVSALTAMAASACM